MPLIRNRGGSGGGGLTPEQDAFVQSGIDLPDDSIPLSRSDNTLGPSIATQSGMSGVLVDGEVSTTKDTLNVGEGLSISEDGGGVKLTDKIDSLSALASGTLLNSDDSTGLTVAYNRSIPANTVLQGDISEDATGLISAWFPITSTRVARNITLRFASVATKIRITLRDSSNQSATDGIILYQSHTDAEFEAGQGFDTTDANKILTFANGAKLVQGRFVYAVIEQGSTGTGTLTLKGVTTEISGVTQFYPYLAQSAQTESLDVLQLESNATQASIGLNAQFNQNSGDTLAIGALVAALDVFETGGVKYVDVIEEKGALTNFVFPIGIMTKAMTNNTQAKNAILIRGEHIITLTGQDDLPIDTKIYIKKTGTGVNEKWILTHDSTGDAYFVGHTTQDAGVDQYHVYLDFSLALSHEHNAGLDDEIQMESNGVALPAKTKTLNIIGRNHALEQNPLDSSQADLRVDPGSLMLAQLTGLPFSPGEPGMLVSNSSGEIVTNVVGAANPKQWPELWASEVLPSGTIGNWIQEGRIENVQLINKSADNRLLVPGDTFATQNIFWDQPRAIFTLDSTADWPIVGSVISSDYTLTRSTEYDSALLIGSTGISTLSGANAVKNGTMLIPTIGSDAPRTFTIPNLSGTQDYQATYDNGDQIAMINPVGSRITLDVETEVGGTMQSISGGAIANYAMSPGNSVIFEKVSNTIWKVVAENSKVVDVDIVVSFDKLSSNRSTALESETESLSNSLSGKQDSIDNLDKVRQATFEGFETKWASNNTITVAPGSCGNTSGSFVLTTSTIITATFSSGITSPGGEVASTWYYVWAHRLTNGTSVTIRFDENGVNPVVPSGYDRGRVIGAVFNDSSSNLRRFDCFGHSASKQYVWLDEVLSLANQTVTIRRAADLSEVVPIVNGGRCTCALTVEFRGAGALRLYHSNESSAFMYGAANAIIMTAPLVRLNSSGQMHIDSNGTTTNVYMKVQGFFLELGV